MTNQQSHPDRNRSKAAILPILLIAALALSYWLHRTPADLHAQEGTTISCFAASNYIPRGDSQQGGILLAWRINITDTATLTFELARAQFTSRDIPGPWIAQESLPGLAEPVGTPNQEEWRYTVTDTGVESSIKYGYLLTVTETISGTVIDSGEHTWSYNDDLESAPQNDEICDLDSTTPTWTATPTNTPTSTPTLHPTDTATPLPPTHTATPTWTPTPTNTQPPSPLVWPTDTPYPSPTFTPLPTETPLPPTPTITPTETPSPTFTPMISAPTPRFDANAAQNQPWVDPNASILPTPVWTPPAPENQQSWPQETPTLPIPVETPPQESVMAESAPALFAQDAIPAPAAMMAPAESSSAAAEISASDEAADTSALPIPSEFRATRTSDNSPILRLALYVVGGLALLSAFAFLIGALALRRNAE